MSALLRVVLLAAVYALTLASADPVDVAGGLLLGGVLVATLRERTPRGSAAGPPVASRLAAFPLFAAGLLLEVARGTWDVALRVLGVRPLERPGIVRVPLGDRTELGAVVSALATTLSPGTVCIDIDQERREMLLHVIDARDPDRVRAEHRHFYERYQRRVFP